MSATNQTAVYGLPIFLGTDVPSWLTDWNGAMGNIDTAIAAAKAAADAAASTAGTAATDIVTINGQITSLQNTVGTHTSQIGTISGNINTINALIGNGTPTTTDQTLIGAINELHADITQDILLTVSSGVTYASAITQIKQVYNALSTEKRSRCTLRLNTTDTVIFRNYGVSGLFSAFTTGASSLNVYTVDLSSEKYYYTQIKADGTTYTDSTPTTMNFNLDLVLN